MQILWCIMHVYIYLFWSSLVFPGGITSSHNTRSIIQASHPRDNGNRGHLRWKIKHYRRRTANTSVERKRLKYCGLPFSGSEYWGKVIKWWNIDISIQSYRNLFNHQRSVSIKGCRNSLFLRVFIKSGALFLSSFLSISNSGKLFYHAVASLFLFCFFGPVKNLLIFRNMEMERERKNKTYK